MGNTLISPPVSAMITSATFVETPRIVFSDSRAGVKGFIASSIRSSNGSIAWVC